MESFPPLSGEYCTRQTNWKSLVFMGVSKTSVGEAARYRYFGGAMKRKELARELARRHHVPVAEARDRVDEAVYDILKKLKEGKPVSLPGIGKLVAKPARTTK